jgi:hypothetical protein
MSPTRRIGQSKPGVHRAYLKPHAMSSPKLDVTGHTAHVRWHRDRWRRHRRRRDRFDRRWRYWRRSDRFYRRRWRSNWLDRRWGWRSDRWRGRQERASHTRRIRRIGHALRIEWAGGRPGGCGRCGGTHPIWTALTRGVPGILQASGVIRTGGQVGGEAHNRRTERAAIAGRRVRGYSRGGYCNNCHGHSQFRIPAADTRTVHLSPS